MRLVHHQMVCQDSFEQLSAVLYTMLREEKTAASVAQAEYD